MAPMRRFVAYVTAASASLQLAACASTQINYNTLDLASTYDGLIVRQVVFNLRKTLETPLGFGVPSFVKVTAATATTQNSLTPSLSIPLSPMSAVTTGVETLTRAGRGLTVAATNQSNQTYTLDPVIDPDQLRRLSAIYRYATGKLSTEDFEVSYPLIEAASSNPTADPTPTVSVKIDGKTVEINSKTSKKPTAEKIIYLRRAFAPPINGRFAGYTYIAVTPDKTFIKTPGCILCDYGNKPTHAEILNIKGIDTGKASLHILQKNISLRQDWLCHSADGFDCQNPQTYPQFGLGDIVVEGTRDGVPFYGIKYFYEFALFTQEASVQGTGSPASGGQSDGRKTENLQRVSVPVAGGSAVIP